MVLLCNYSRKKLCLYRTDLQQKVTFDQIKIKFHLYSKRPHMHTHKITTIEFIRILAAATINFSLAGVQLLIEAGNNFADKAILGSHVMMSYLLWL